MSSTTMAKYMPHDGGGWAAWSLDVVDSDASTRPVAAEVVGVTVVGVTLKTAAARRGGVVRATR